MDGVGDLPPSIKQKFAASMLSKNSDLLQGNEGTKGRQGAAAYYKDTDEAQTNKLANVAASSTFVDANGKTVNSLMALNDGLNQFQVTLVQTASTFVSAIAKMQSKMKDTQKESSLLERMFK
jgi:hypothetical protein